ncbi:MAG: dephospho-CoA kinase [Coleofasciculaceae cyanobacterium SM2_1_6]|nr:dephospho-CoA kinase [Coleofasciculaceae cyanobacterium SM2_1_6]
MTGNLTIKSNFILQRIIGLTGGIASGKSTVARYLQERHGLLVFDADLYAREAVVWGSPILEQIIDRYGAEILGEKQLDRRRLGEIIFRDPAEKQWLEQQIHPFVRQRFERDIAQHPTQDMVLVVPLLIEAQMTDLVNQVWVVTCTQEQQLARLVSRDQLSPAAAQGRIDSQMPLAQKIPLAEVVLDNTGDRAELLTQIDRAMNYQ